MSETAKHTIKSFEQELTRLRDILTEMGGMVESQVALASEAVLSSDSSSASTAVELDPRVDQMERSAEQLAIKLLALRQPVADDLRHIFAALKIAADFERIGDYAANMAKRSIVLEQFQLPFALTGFSHMSRLVQDNLKNVVDAYGAGDSEKALEVWRADEVIDDIYNALFRELITYMMEDPRNITPCAHLLFVAKNMERIGDHVTNVAETVYYAVVGQALTEKRPKGDNSAFAVVRPPND